MNGRRAALLAAVVSSLLYLTRIALSDHHLHGTRNNDEPLDLQIPTLRSSRRALSNNEFTNLSANDIIFKKTNDPKNPYGRCRVPRPHIAGLEQHVGTLYQPAFPGSGSRMTYELVQTLTGMTIANDHNYAVDPNVHNRVVSVKTHYPNRNGISLEEFDADFEGALLIIRNPIKAIPSFFNFWYERTNHLENHSVRAPTEEWIAFRDANLEEQLKSWRQHMDYWLKKYQDDRSKLLVLSYEHLTDDKRGPGTALKLAMFLDSVKGVKAAKPQDVACLWHHSVKYMDEGESVEGHSVRVGPTATPYTAKQFDEIRSALQVQKWKYKDDPEIYKIMDQYMRHINHSWLYIT